jgi:hypothetical protein
MQHGSRYGSEVTADSAEPQQIDNDVDSSCTNLRVRMSKKPPRGKNKDPGRKGGQGQRKPVPEPRRSPEEDLSKEDAMPAPVAQEAEPAQGDPAGVVDKFYRILTRDKPLWERLIEAGFFIVGVIALFVTPTVIAVVFVSRVLHLAPPDVVTGILVGGGIGSTASTAIRWVRTKR